MDCDSYARTRTIGCNCAQKFLAGPKEGLLCTKGDENYSNVSREGSATSFTKNQLILEMISGQLETLDTLIPSLDALDGRLRATIEKKRRKGECHGCGHKKF